MSKGKYVAIAIAIIVFFVACSSVAGSHVYQAQFTNDTWRYATDPHGSKAIIASPLVTAERVKIVFERVPRVDKNNNSWVELIHDLPSGEFNHRESIKVTYKSDQPLLIKLSQLDYGGEGDKSYAHYQIQLSPSLKWRTKTLQLTDFTRPSWTPSWSNDVGIDKSHVKALYFVPDLTDALGGNASIEISELILF